MVLKGDYTFEKYSVALAPYGSGKHHAYHNAQCHTYIFIIEINKFGLEPLNFIYLSPSFV